MIEELASTGMKDATIGACLGCSVWSGLDTCRARLNEVMPMRALQQQAPRPRLSPGSFLRSTLSTGVGRAAPGSGAGVCLSGVVQGFMQNWAIRHTVQLACSDNHIRFLESILWIEERDRIHQRLGLAIPIDLIEARPNDVLSHRGTQHCHCIGIDASPSWLAA